MMRARTTVVIAAPNRADELIRTLEHLCALRPTPPVIVVDNASTDGTADAVVQSHPAVTVIRGRHNMGAVARNLAVRYVRTQYVAFCDDDTSWQPGAPEYGSRSARPVSKARSRHGPLPRRARVDRGPDRAGDAPLTGAASGLAAWPALLGVMADLSMFRVSAFRQAGGFCPRLWFGGEEELLALDLAAGGWWLLWPEEIFCCVLVSRRWTTPVIGGRWSEKDLRHGRHEEVPG